MFPFLEKSLFGKDRKQQYRVVLVGVLLLLFFSASFLYHFFSGNLKVNEETQFGVTFSKKYAEELELDWKKTYLAILDELEVEYFRIPAYWDQIEPKEHQYDFSDLDWMLEEAAKREAKVVLAIGRKLPRWPECHDPAWAENLPEEMIQQKTLSNLTLLVRRYKNHPALWRWQLENEPLFVFGECPLPDQDFLRKEAALVRSLDEEHPIVITDSGELSTWYDASHLADILGISMYRRSFNKLFGYIYYPLKPGFYRDHAALVSPLIDEVFVSELQAEPWVTKRMVEVPIAEQKISMDEELFKENIDFAKELDSLQYFYGE